MNITLIFTRHKEGGACTSDASLKIIDFVKPDVIFEELTEAQYKAAYEDLSLNNLESAAVRTYLANHEVPHIPVDTFERPNNYDEDQNLLNHKLSTEAGYASIPLRNFLDDIIAVGNQYGFHYLNDATNDANIELLDDLKRKALRNLNKPKLDEIYRIGQEVTFKREDVMLENVYNYAAENPFENGLLFIGSGHRASMLRKIERTKTENTMVEWKLYQDLIPLKT